MYIFAKFYLNINKNIEYLINMSLYIYSYPYSPMPLWGLPTGLRSSPSTMPLSDLGQSPTAWQYDCPTVKEK